MTEKGRVIEILQKRSGISPRTGNTWATQGFVIETNDRFPIKIAFTLFGEENIQKAQLRIGEQVAVDFYAESHKSGDNWFTDLRALDIISNNVSRLRQLQMAPTQ